MTRSGSAQPAATADGRLHASGVAPSALSVLVRLHAGTVPPPPEITLRTETFAVKENLTDGQAPYGQSTYLRSGSTSDPCHVSFAIAAPLHGRRQMAWRGTFGLVNSSLTILADGIEFWIEDGLPMNLVDLPVDLIETINRIVRASRQMLHEIGREPTPDELAEKLAMPLEDVRKVLEIAKLRRRSV
jgi:hypothetical protein